MVYNIEFPGQQEGERILYHTKPHKFMMYLNFAKVFLTGILGIVAIESLALFLEMPILGILGLILTGSLMFLGLLWVYHTYEGSDMYVTDRRIVRFLPTFPFSKRIRSLFWEDVVKIKTFRKHYVLEGILRIGSIEIHAKSSDKDNIDIHHLVYHEDLGNYIDKILYIYRNKPSELENFPPFIEKPAGKRG